MSKSYFSDKELACKCGACDGGNHMNTQFMAKLNKLREVYGKPIRLSSAYRCPLFNERVSDTGNKGPHTMGQAVDILVSGEDAYHILVLATEMGFTGIGIKQHGAHDSRFIHLDTLTHDLRPWVWSY